MYTRNKLQYSTQFYSGEKVLQKTTQNAVIYIMYTAPSIQLYQLYLCIPEFGAFHHTLALSYLCIYVFM